MLQRTLTRGALSQSDSPIWHTEPNYSPAIALVLACALAYARSGDCLMAYNCVQPYVARPMSLRQRLIITYLLALSHFSVADYTGAAAHLDDAAELALRLSQHDALVDIGYLHGAANRAMSRFPAALSDFSHCLDAVQTSGDTVRALNSDLEMAALLSVAAIELLLAQYERCIRHLEEARLLSARLPTNDSNTALIAWIAAALERWRGHPERAMAYATSACEALVGDDNLSNNGRILTLLADITLDLATGDAPTAPAHPRLARLARRHADRALTLARHASDKTGVHMARLTQARVQRLSGDECVQIPAIEDIMRYAQHTGDTALLCQAYSALGDDFARRSESDPAKNAYRTALSIADQGEIPAYATFPRRQLFHLCQMPERSA